MNVSVVIPVFGVEKYIERCARSLFEQTMSEGIEFIFVDDATEDKSIEILENVLESYPERIAQVTILHHDKNQGLAAARRTGVKVAAGDYIIHCDSDDWVEPEMYQLLYETAKLTDADIVGCDIIEEFPWGSKVLKQDFDLSILEQCKKMLDVRSRKLERYVWNRMFRRSFYNKIGLKNPDINLWEDLCITVPAHALAEKISYVPKALYHYNRMNSNSLVASLNIEKVGDMMIAGRYLQFTLQNTIKTTELKKSLNNRLLACKMPLISNRSIFNPSKWRSLWPSLSISSYPSLKMKIIMYLANTKHDFILERIISLL